MPHSFDYDDYLASKMSVKEKIQRVTDLAHDLLNKKRTVASIRIGGGGIVSISFRIQGPLNKQTYNLVCNIVKTALDASVVFSGIQGGSYLLSFSSTHARVASAQETARRRAKQQDALRVIVFVSFSLTAVSALASLVLCVQKHWMGRQTDWLVWLSKQL